ncbi:MAG: hypothetical protein M1814_004771 [Vezdaea aestivalis]|nr:MAG: hypothetical protein M1814_004771 [Vezdaea aestivalis]
MTNSTAPLNKTQTADFINLKWWSTLEGRNMAAVMVMAAITEMLQEAEAAFSTAVVVVAEVGVMEEEVEEAEVVRHVS